MGAGADTQFERAAGELPDASVSNDELAPMAAGTVKGRQIDAGIGAPADLNGAEQAENLRYATVQTPAVSTSITLNADTTVLRLTPSGTQSVNDMTAGTLGRLVLIENIAGFGNTLSLTSLNAGSAADTRFRTPLGQPYILGFRESVWARWEGDWRVLSKHTHDDPVFVKYVSCPSGGAAGTADDVTVWSASAPFALRILDATLRVSTAVGGSSAALRTASGGGGSVVLPDPGTPTQTFSTATTGPHDDVAVATATVASGGSLFLRRSDRSVVGELILTCVRT